MTRASFQRMSLACATAAAFFPVAALAQQQQFPLPPKEWPSPIEDHPAIPYFLADRLEYRAQSGKDAAVWDLHAWYGGDYNKLWLKSEGEKSVGGNTERADFQALYARLVSPFWYLQGGLRAESKPSPSRSSAVLGIQGIAPYWFNVEAAAFVSEKGKLSARLETEYDFLFTQRLILQPRFEINVSGSSDPERGLGRGVNDVELGFRLRYEIKREIAPYIGVSWSRKPGETGDLARAAGKETRETAVFLGLRLWY